VQVFSELFSGSRITILFHAPAAPRSEQLVCFDRAARIDNATVAHECPDRGAKVFELL
jgi:hypothetical protein